MSFWLLPLKPSRRSIFFLLSLILSFSFYLAWINCWSFMYWLLAACWACALLIPFLMISFSMSPPRPYRKFIRLPLLLFYVVVEVGMAPARIMNFCIVLPCCWY